MSSRGLTAGSSAFGGKTLGPALKTARDDICKRPPLTPLPGLLSDVRK